MVFSVAFLLSLSFPPFISTFVRIHSHSLIRSPHCVAQLLACWALLRVHFDIAVRCDKSDSSMLIEIRSSRHVELATLNITITIKTKLLIHGSNFVENGCSDATVPNVELYYLKSGTVALCFRRNRRRSLAHQTSSVLHFTVYTYPCMRPSSDRARRFGLEKSLLLHDVLINMRSRNSYNFRPSISTPLQ